METLQSLNWIEGAAFFLIMVRVSAILWNIPYLEQDIIGPRVKVGAAFFIAVFAFPVARKAIAVDLGDPYILTAAIAMEILLGLGIAYIIRCFTMAVQMGADAAGIQMGLGAAQMFDPQTQSMSNDFAVLFTRLVTMLFLIMNIDHYLIQALYFSFESIPVGAVAMNQPVLFWLIGLSTSIPAVAFQMVAPIIVVILLIHVAFGIVAKSVPNINIYFLSSIVTIFIGMGVFLFSLPHVASGVEQEFFKINQEILKLIRAVKG